MESHRGLIGLTPSLGSASHRGRYRVLVSTPEELLAVPVMWLRTSPYVVVPPPIDRNSYAVVRATDFTNVQDMFDAYPTALDFLIVLDGGTDFRSWGAWVVNGNLVANGTADRYRTIRFFSPGVDHLHPYDRDENNEALIESIQFTNGAAYWMVIGFTQRETVTDNDIRDDCHHIVYSRFFVDRQTGNYGFRSRGGDGCIVQQSVLIGPDLVGSVATGGLIGFSVDIITSGMTQSGFKALDNEVRNYKDGILVGRLDAEPFSNIDVLTEGNDYVHTEDRRFANGTGPYENGIDIKGSSDLVQCVSRRDRIRGCRKTGPGAGANGDGLELHRQGRNWLFDEVFFDDCGFGFHEVPWDSPTDLNTPRNMVFDNCQFTRIRNYANVTGGGACFRAINNLRVNGGWAANCDGVLYCPSATLRAGGPVFTGFTRTNTPVTVPLSAASPYVEADNFEGDPNGTFQLIECNRWTGRVYVYGARVDAPLQNREPLAAFSAPLTGGTVNIANESVAYDATIVSYSYDWGDDSPVGTTAQPSHTYALNGPYTITLTVTDSNGLTHTTQRNILVTALAEPAMPRYQGAGTVLKTAGAGSPGLPTGTSQYDVLLAVTVSQGTQPVTASAANGYTQITGSPVDVGLAAGSALGVWWRRVGSRAAGQPDELDASLVPVWNNPGDHLLSVIFRFDRCARLSDPVEVVATSFITSASTDVTIPGATTLAANRMVVAMCTTGFDGDTGQFSNWTSTAPSLTAFTERFNEGTSQGNGSGLGVVTGEKIAQGAFGDITAVLANIFRQARLTLVLKGQEP